MTRTFIQQMIRIAGIFQGITALPIMLDMGFWALFELWYPHYRIYRFMYETAACTGLMAAGVLFTILVQRHPNNTKSSTLYLEITKSGLATALWLWLILDALFAFHESDQWSSQPEEQRKQRIARAALSVFVLPVLYYSTLVLASIEVRGGHSESVGDVERDVTEEEREREPLLRERLI